MVIKLNYVLLPHVSEGQISTLHHLSTRVAFSPPPCNEMNNWNSEQSRLLHNIKHFQRSAVSLLSREVGHRPVDSDFAVMARNLRCWWERLFDQDNEKVEQGPCCAGPSAVELSARRAHCFGFTIKHVVTWFSTGSHWDRCITAE